MLKQADSPIPVANQVIMLFALTHGYLEKVTVDQVKHYEEQLYDYIETTQSDILDVINTSGELPDHDVLDSILRDFGDIFRSVLDVD